MDNIIFEKIWIDPIEDFFELKVMAYNDRITMVAHHVYAVSTDIHKIQSGAKEILKGPFSIDLGYDDDSSVDCVKLSFVPNKLGRVLVLIYMKTDSYEDKKDKANFTIETEISSLDRFASELEKILEGDIGVKVQLHD